MFFTYSVCFFYVMVIMEIQYMYIYYICIWLKFANQVEVNHLHKIVSQDWNRRMVFKQYIWIFGYAVDAVCWKCNFKNKSRVINRSGLFQPASVCCYIKAPWGLDSPPFKLWSYRGFMHIYNDIKWVIVWAAATWPVGFNKCIIAGTEAGTEVYHIYLLPFTRPFRYDFNKR